MSRTSLVAHCLIWTVCASPLGCIGTVVSNSGDPPDTADPLAPPTAGQAGLPKPPSTGGDPQSPGGAGVGSPGSATFRPLRRLSRDELVASFQVLVGAAPARHDLPEDQRDGHQPLKTTGVWYLRDELQKLKTVSDGLAARQAPALLAASGCNREEQAQRDCLIGWAAGVAERAFRRPPTEPELARLRQLFSAAGSSTTGDTTAVQAALSAILFAPSFLYRVEGGSPVPGNPLVRQLGDAEVAVRLSYLATLGPPDADLTQAAVAGRLKDPAERARQLERLAATDRGRDAMAAFVLEWLGATESKIRDKSPKYLSGLSSGFEAGIRASAQATLRAALAGMSPTLANVLTTTEYLGASEVKSVTNPTGSATALFGDQPETARAGLLMHPYVISAHTKEDGPSPFQIGVFIKEALLCEVVPSPPPDAVAQANNDVPQGLSSRQDLEFRSSGQICQACHALFAPFGFAFLPFDPVGRWTKQDPMNGMPWDLAGQVPTHSGVPLAFASPGELVRKMALHQQVQDCFADAALRWAFGRDVSGDDRATAALVAEVSRRTQGNLPAIWKAIVQSPSFLHSVAQR